MLHWRQNRLIGWREAQARRVKGSLGLIALLCSLWPAQRRLTPETPARDQHRQRLHPALNWPDQKPGQKRDLKRDLISAQDRRRRWRQAKPVLTPDGRRRAPNHSMTLKPLFAVSTAAL
jgi:hypothetical protein